MTAQTFYGLAVIDFAATVQSGHHIDPLLGQRSHRQIISVGAVTQENVSLLERIKKAAQQAHVMISPVAHGHAQDRAAAKGWAPNARFMGRAGVRAIEHTAL